MIRLVTGLLIIVVIFLAGVIVGGDKVGQTSDPEPAEVKDEELIQREIEDENNIVDTNMDSERHEEMLVDSDAASHPTQKIASSLESVVKGFYEMIVQLFYSFANLFF